MIAVRNPQPHEFKTALELLYHRLSRHERQDRVEEALSAIRNGELSPRGLLLAEIDGRPAGAMLTALQADKTAFVWPPVVRDDPDADHVAAALVQNLASWLDDAGAWLGQCILEPHAAHDREIMSRNGFPHLTDLVYLERPCRAPLSAAPDVQLESEMYDAARNRDRFERMLEATYRGTQDCPELSGLRSAGAALDGHRCSGEFDPARWKIYSVNGADVGVLLLNDHPDQDAWEIVYLGIAESFRGRGYGLAMLLSGCRDARESGRNSLLVAVDCRNERAIKLYRAAGFAEIAVKSVHARIGGTRETAR